MPANFPGSIYDPREIENVSGVSYEPSKKTRFYAEDLNNTNAEVVAIETILGENPQGSYDTVADRLDAGGVAAWGSITGTLSDQTDLLTALNGKQASLGFTPENVANKSTNVVTDQASNTKYPSVKSVYDWVVANFATPLGFTPENVANKSTNVVTDQASNTKYPSVKSVYDWVVSKISDTAYGSTWNGVTDIAPSKNAVYDQMEIDVNQDFLNILKGLGSPLLAVPALGTIITTNRSLVDGTIHFIPIWIKRSLTITGVKFLMAAQGIFTADNNNRIGLYSYSGGTITLVASCANDANLWKAATNTFVAKAFSSTYAASPGLYFIGALFNTSAPSTLPSVGACPLPSSSNWVTFDFTNSAKLLASLAGQTNLSGSHAMSALSASFENMWFGLY